MKKSWLIILLFLAYGQYALADGVTRGYKLARKHKYQKALKVICKQLAKDSAHPGALYVKAYILAQPTYAGQHLDSAHSLLKKAKTNWPGSAQKKLKRYRKKNIDTLAFAHLGQQIDSKAFAQAQQASTEQAYLHFLQSYPQAAQVPRAKLLRDSVAFDAAQQQGTYQAYRQFLKKYPNALQATQARKQYDRLVFEAVASGGDLEDLELFIKQYPENEYAPRVHKRIYQLSTQTHTEQAYRNFINKHPNSPHLKQAWHWLLALSLRNHSPWQLRQTMAAYPTTHFAKWMRHAALPLLPFYMVNSYGLITSNGDVAVRPTFTQPPTHYECAPLKGAFFGGKQGANYGMVDAIGRITVPFAYSSLEHLSAGAVAVSNHEGFGAVATTGFEILPCQYQSVEAVGSHLLKAQQNNQYALFSYQGNQLSGFIFDQIDTLEGFVVFKRGQLFALAKTQHITKHDYQLPKLEFQYHEVEPTPHGLVLVRVGAHKGLLSANLTQVIHVQYNIIDATPFGFVAQKNNPSTGQTLHFLLNSQGKPLSSYSYQKVYWNQFFYICKANNKWGLLSPKGSLIKKF